MGIFACRLRPEGELPPDFGTQLSNRNDLTQFEGLTGSVAFDGIGNRDVRTASFRKRSCDGRLNSETAVRQFQKRNRHLDPEVV
jgi:hypothetical protein